MLLVLLIYVALFGHQCHANSDNFRHYLHSQCSPGGSLSCLAINDLSVDPNCLVTLSCNVFAVFKFTAKDNYISDIFRFSLYRFSRTPPKSKHHMSLAIKYGEHGTRYECIYSSNGTVKGRVKMPNRPVITDDIGLVSDNVLSCHWMLSKSPAAKSSATLTSSKITDINTNQLDDDDFNDALDSAVNIDDETSLWPRYGPNEHIDLINQRNVSFELWSNGIHSLLPINTLPIYRLKYLREGCNRPNGRKFCYHWKEFERTWIIIEQFQDQPYLHALLLLSINFTRIEVKFSRDTGFGDDFTVTCDRFSCKESLYQFFHQPIPRQVIWDVGHKTNGPITRIHFCLPIFFTINDVDFFFGSPFFVNFKINRNHRVDSVWTPKIDLKLTLPRTKVTTVDPPIPGSPEPAAANKNRLYGSASDSGYLKNSVTSSTIYFIITSNLLLTWVLNIF